MANSSPMFSIIMPVFNREQYLSDAINSVLEQSFSDWELVIIDDGSIDASPSMIDRFCLQDSRVRGVHQQNQGAAAARNRGVELATAQWLCYLDSDDVWFPDTLASFANYLSAHSSAQFIYGYRHRLEDGMITELAGKHMSSPTGPRELFQKMFLHPMSVCHRRNHIERVGGFDEKLPLNEDYDLFLRMSPELTFEPIGVATGLRRRHDTNLSQQTGFSRMVQVGVLLRFLTNHGGDKLIPPAESAKRLRQILYSAGRQYFRARAFDKSRRAFQEARRFGLPLKGKLLDACARLLEPLAKDDGRSWPLPLPPAGHYLLPSPRVSENTEPRPVTS